MSDDFFGDLSKSISRATQSAVGKTNVLIESTKLSSQISGEQKEIDKLFRSIGEIVYAKSATGELVISEEVTGLVDEIRNHKSAIFAMKKNLAEVKGMKVCPQCREIISSDVAFCPKCGAPIAEPDAQFLNKRVDETEES